MQPAELTRLLADFKRGVISEDDVISYLKRYASDTLDFAHIDHHRSLRKGFPVVVFCPGKTNEQILAIITSIYEKDRKILATKATPENYEFVHRRLPQLVYYPEARIITSQKTPNAHKKGSRTILVVSAGTSDIPIAEEAAVTAEAFGNHVERIHDIGVSGIHRLFGYTEKFQKAYVIIVVAGMEGALSSVIGGLVDKPVIAVPTSIGYGASFDGLAALLGMLNSCASGVTVVNIDNGFGAGYAASLIARA